MGENRIRCVGRQMDTSMNGYDRYRQEWAQAKKVVQGRRQVRPLKLLLYLFYSL